MRPSSCPYRSSTVFSAASAVTYGAEYVTHGTPGRASRAAARMSPAITCNGRTGPECFTVAIALPYLSTARALYSSGQDTGPEYVTPVPILL